MTLLTPKTRSRDTTPPSTGPEEKDVLLGFLSQLRGAIAAKATGVTDDQVRRPGVPSGTSLLGLVSHLTHVERHYFLGERVRSWPATWKPDPDRTPEEVIATYRETVTQADAVLDGYTDLTQPAPVPAGKQTAPSMRWLLAHMIEETGRHAGHADILRELIDGSTGR